MLPELRLSQAFCDLDLLVDATFVDLALHLLFLTPSYASKDLSSLTTRELSRFRQRVYYRSLQLTDSDMIPNDLSADLISSG